MKGLLIILNILFPTIALTSSIFYSINGILLIKWLAGLAFVLQGGINLIYLIKTRPEKKIFGFYAFSGLLFTYFASMLVSNYVVWTMILFAVVCVLNYLANLKIFAFKTMDIIYGVCIAVPMGLLIITDELKALG